MISFEWGKQNHYITYVHVQREKKIHLVASFNAMHKIVFLLAFLENWYQTDIIIIKIGLLNVVRFLLLFFFFFFFFF